MKVAILGCGTMGRAHGAAYRALGAQVTAVCDTNPQSAAALAHELGCPAYADAGQLLGEQRPQAVSICTPANAHAEAIALAASAGCAILCEKPLAWSLEQAFSAARSVVKTPFRLGFKMRYEDVYAEAWRILDSGELGKPRNVFISHFQPLSDPAWYMDVGVTSELLIHSFDIACWVFREKPARVRMQSQRLLGRSGEDQATVELWFSDNGKAVVAGGYMPGYPLIRGQHDFVFQFQGEKGYVAGKRNGGIAVFSPQGIRELRPEPRNAFEWEINDFLKAVRGEEAGGATLHDALVSQLVLEAALASDRSGQPEAVAGIPTDMEKE